MCQEEHTGVIQALEVNCIRHVPSRLKHLQGKALYCRRVGKEVAARSFCQYKGRTRATLIT
jgi:hypothetical protein